MNIYFSRILFMVSLILFLQLPAEAQSKSKNAVRHKKKKAQKELTWFGKGWQDMNARYNAYFNAKTIMDASMLQMRSSQQENYDEILPVFVYDAAKNPVAANKNGEEGGIDLKNNPSNTSPKDIRDERDNRNPKNDKDARNNLDPKANNANNANVGGGAQGDMERVIQKTTAAVQLRPNSKWVDNCYLLMGQANFFKGDYQAATDAFQYIGKNFKYNKRIERKLQKGKVKRNRKMPNAGAAGNASIKGPLGLSKDASKELKLKQKEKDEKQKEREQEIKEREKKNYEKKREMERQKKIQERERAKRNKEKQKQIKQRKKGKKPSSKSSKNDKKDKNKTEENKPEESTITEPQTEDVVEEETPAEEETVEEEETLTEDTTTAEEAEEPENENIVEEDNTDAFASESLSTDKVRTQKYGLLAHKPVRYQAMLWLARTYMSQNNYSDALSVLNTASEQRGIPKKEVADLYALIADYHLKNNENDQAIEALTKAAGNSRKKADKARYNFIIGQLYEQNLDYAQTVTYMEKVLKNKPVYPMAFKAKLNIAEAKMLSGEYTAEQATRYLEKMLKDDKNTDYQDQIYFALSEIALANGDTETAMSLLQQSAGSSTQNSQQKGESFLKLAELLYKNEQFARAALYYDSTMQLLPKTHPKYDQIEVRSKVLNELSIHYQTVMVEDSLQRLASMPEKERNKIIDDLIRKMEEEAALKAQQEQAFLQAANNNKDNKDNNNSNGTWYFYNTTQKSSGFTQFQNTWGNRPLVDNWRRSAAILGTAGGGNIIAENSNNLPAMGDFTVLKREDFIKNLPTSAEQKQESNARIAEALYQMGKIYKEQLNNDTKAIQAFERLANDYPNNEHLDEVAYSLYLLYQKTNPAKADTYKNLVLNKFPNSVYAGLIKDPQYASKSAEENKQVLSYYEQTYNLYEQNKYEQVLSRRQEAKTLFASSDLQPQFDLLAAFAIGSLQGREPYISALESIVKDYPSGDVNQRAKEILSYLKKNSNTSFIEDPNANIYKENFDTEHYLVATIVDKNDQSVISTALSDFSGTNFPDENLKTTSMLLDPQTPIIVVKTFRSGENAMNYYTECKAQKENIFRDIPSKKYKLFVISKENFAVFFKDKNADTYQNFFKQYYETK